VLADSTNDLLARAQSGDEAALSALLERFLPRLKRWVRGRLPDWCRDLADTDDLVQDAVMRTIKHLPVFEPRGDAALEVYFRRVLLNRVREEIRRSRPQAFQSASLTEHLTAPRSAFGAADDQCLRLQYETALETLAPDDRVAVVGRLELGYTFAELAEALGKRTPDAARKHTQRAVSRLVDRMRNDRE
jgi:RNA polymerase sigma-70 factor, ECF subfamily